MRAEGTRRVREWMKLTPPRMCDFPDPPGANTVSPRTYGLKAGGRRSASLTVGALAPLLQGPLTVAVGMWSAATAATTGGAPLLSLSVRPGSGADIDVGLGPLPGGILGSTAPQGSPITLNSSVAWAPAAPVGPGQQNLLAVLVHELGHALGLLHSTNRTSTMWPFGGQQVLGEEDVAAIRALYGWSDQAPVPDIGTDTSPALCALPGELVLAWKGIDETGLWFARSADGQTWSSQNTMRGSASTDGPTLAWDGSRLWMAWRGVDGDTSLYWSTSSDAGRSWAPQQPIPGVASSQGPSMTIHRGIPLLVWRGVDGDSGLYYTAWNSSGWLPQESVGGTGSTDRPAVCVDVHGSPRMVWRGIPGDDDLYLIDARRAP